MNASRSVCTLLFAWLLLVLLALPLAVMPAAADDQPLTNDQVVKMLAAGLSEDVVVLAIERQPASFDLSPQGLIALKEQKVPESVIKAMLAKESTASAGPAPAKATAGGHRGVVLRDGTEITVRLRHAISSATAAVNETVLFEAAEDVVIDGVTVVRKGAEGRGKVITAEPKRSFGRQGKLDFTIDVVEASNGQNVSLRATQSAKGQEKYAKAGVITLLTGPFGYFVKGRDIDIPAGTEYTIFIDGDRSFEF